MKILALFIDMLGGEYSNLCNEEAAFNCMDEFMQKLGGTLYSNCYSPGPDTPRSCACMWSGLYPKANYCTNRIKWPRDSMNLEVDNIWNVLASKGYNVNIFMDHNADEMGLIPLTGEEHVYTDSIYQFFEHAVISENSFNLFYLPDVHYMMNVLGYTMDNYNTGLQFQLSLVNEIFAFYEAKENFDYIIIFSDHGYWLADGKKHEHLIENERVRTIVMIHQKGDTELVIDRQLRSNLDVMPTICEMLDYVPRNRIDGISCFAKQGHDYILIEDMDNFSVSLGLTIDHWCVVLEDGSKHWLECDRVWTHQDSKIKFDEKLYEVIIRQKMCDYEENAKAFPTFYKYQQYFNKHNEMGRYSNGQLLDNKAYMYEDIKRLHGRKIVLYGAGQVGKDYYKQIVKNGACEIVAWVDLNYEECKNTDRNIEGINRLFEIDYDYVLVCIVDEKIAKQIRNMLEQLHICQDKILWSKPQIYREPRIETT